MSHYSIQNRRYQRDTDDIALRLLIIDPNAERAAQTRSILAGGFRGLDCFDVVASLSLAKRQLAVIAYDCVFIADPPPMAEILGKWSNDYPDMPVVLHAKMTPSEALGLMHAGAEDCLDSTRTDPDALLRSVRYAVGRRLARNQALRLSEALERERELILLQREFVALVTHEFRTPLSIIHNAEQMLRMRLPEDMPPAVNKSLGKITRCLERLDQLVDNIILYSRLEEGQSICQPIQLNIEALAHDIIERLHDVYPGQRIIMRKATTNAFYGDPALCEHIIAIILTNALKYSPETAKVVLELLPTDSYYGIRITDYGIGMTPANLERIGEKFFRAQQVKHIPGSGLGLHLACRLIEYHKGQIYICSAENAGTIIDLRFPLA